MYRLLSLLGIAIGAASVPIGIGDYLETHNVLSSLLWVVGLVGFAIPFVFPVASHEQAVRDLEMEKALKLDDWKPDAQRAARLYRAHENEMKRYYDQILRQGAWIFATGLALLAMGFVIILVTLYFIVSSPPGTDITKQVITGVIGGSGSFATDFVGAIYLSMYHGASDAVGKFHDALVATHDLYYANLLAAQLKDGNVAQSALEKIALTIAKVPLPPSGATPPGPAQK
ncbi:MAG TPA: hypothetical protein VEY12_10815 [Thermoplasmata archaeon]|nr:hypothetical protein [Thermoplasmata archaeon]